MKDLEQYWPENEKSYRYVTPIEFAEAFLLTDVGISLANELAIPIPCLLVSKVAFRIF